MGVLVGLARGLGRFNAAVLTLGMWIGAALLGLMVAAILMQVVFRYILGNALPWSEEASRFMMMWLTGLMAPTAYRTGGFVGIELLVAYLPRALAAAIALAMLLLTTLVLAAAVSIGWSEVTGIGGRFELSALKIPRAFMMGGLFTGFVLLLLVNVELILRSLIALAGREADLPRVAHIQAMGAE
jgi:TRAP-type C4-dicarboxylate transport system permease small subunit